MILPDQKQIIDMTPGPALDRLVHELVIKAPKGGRIPKYSTDITKAIDIIDALTLSVGSLAPTTENWTPTRPYWAGCERFLVTANTAALALCKASLLFLNEPPAGSVPESTLIHQPAATEEQAEDEAALN